MQQWYNKRVFFWETAPFFRILLPFILGILCYDSGFFHFRNALLLYFTIVLLSLAIIFFYFFKTSNKYVSLVYFLCLYTVFFVFGITVSYVNDIRNDKNWFGHNVHTSYIARITDVPKERKNSWKIPLSVICTIKDQKAIPVKGDAFIYISKGVFSLGLNKGDTILLPQKWEPIKNMGYPFEFDYAKYCARNNIFYRQFSNENSISLISHCNPKSLPLLDKCHDWCMNQIDKYITDSSAKGLIEAMILGDEVNLDENLRQSWSETGIVHVIAISGGNVSIFFIAISFMFYGIKSKQRQWIKLLFSLPFVWFYVLIAGGSPSAIRAATMFSFLALSVILQKSNNILNHLFATCFILLFFRPMWLFSIGFQLSFIAVLSLIVFNAHISNWLIFKNKFLRGIWNVVAASISAEILVAPLVIYYFHNFPVFFILTNVLAYFFMGIVQILSMLVISFGGMPIIATLIGTVITYIVMCFNKIIFYFQHHNSQFFLTLKLSSLELFIVYLSIVFFSVYFILKKSRYLFIGLSMVCILVLLSTINQYKSLHQHRVVVYNVGKNSKIELITGKSFHELMYDTTIKNNTDYAVKAAHIGWQALIGNTDTITEVFKIKDKSVLLLRRELYPTEEFHFDYLIVCNNKKTDLVRIQKVFTPEKIITCNKISIKQTSKWNEKNITNKAQLYSVFDNGAFIIE